MPLRRPLCRVLSSRSRTPASNTQAARKHHGQHRPVEVTQQQGRSTPNTTLPSSTGASMPSNQRIGVSFQRTSTPTAMASISTAISGRNSALK